ncbi:hypothetical protein [Sulfodiicoccus acidiphilus]|uniref:hypothetical protein n=1 Tax=Sulfodiicoccus acidiphilus TaxID=1670455 RepID=UPI000F8229B3|nr:hypothetical protein [Sulfodiicoccus acidiphilus]
MGYAQEAEELELRMRSSQSGDLVGTFYEGPLAALLSTGGFHVGLLVKRCAYSRIRPSSTSFGNDSRLRLRGEPTMTFAVRTPALLASSSRVAGPPKWASLVQLGVSTYPPLGKFPFDRNCYMVGTSK